MERKPFRFPKWLKVTTIIMLFVIDFLILLTLIEMGKANLAVFIGMVFVLLIWPLILRFSVSRLYEIRRKYLEAIRADEQPKVSVRRIMGYFAVLFSPALMLAMMAFILPWGVAAAFFVIPAVVLVVGFGAYHAAAWVDVGLKVRGYILYLAGLLTAASAMGILIGQFM